MGVAFLLGCGVKEEVGEVPGVPRVWGWGVEERSPKGERAYLCNGRLGVRLFPSGLGVGKDGLEVPSLVMFKDAVVRVPSLAFWRIFVDGQEVRLEEGSAYWGELNFRNGLWFAQWEGKAGDEKVRVRVEALVHPERSLFGQRLEVSCGEGKEVRVESLFSGAGVPVGMSPGFYEVRLEGIPISEPEARVLGSRVVLPVRVGHKWLPASSWSFLPIKGGWAFWAKAGREPLVLERIVGVAESGEVPFWGSLLREAEAIWSERWKTDIEIEGPVEDQQAIRSFLFYLYADGNAKLPPMGLSDERYKGHRFWDAEAWMLPVYAFLRPSVALEATEWRLRFWREFFGSSRWWRVPWESGIAGDQTPPAFREALHVGGWVFWWLERAKALGFIRREEAEEAQIRIARFFYVRALERGGKFHLLGVVSPDEGRLRDNDLVTNLLAKYCAWTVAGTFRGVSEEDRRMFRDFGERVVLPRVDGIPATYEKDPLKGYQQASALLALFPLEWDFGEEINGVMFDRYKDRVSPLGPAMSESVHSVIASRLGRGEEAYRRWRASWEGYLRKWMGFSERRNLDRVYFLTGAGGCVGAVLYGFLGIRVTQNPSVPPLSGKGGGAVPAGDSRFLLKPLGDGYFFEARSQLPPSWRRVRVRGFWLRGERYTLEATHEGIWLEKEG